jgi:AraC family transcriptional regulator
MNYITAREAALRWGVTARQVQALCKNGEVAGAIRFNRSYAIPRGAPKPKDGRCRETDAREGQVAVPEISEGLFKEIFDRFPYRINITAADGTLVYANGAFSDGMLEGFQASLLGQYNIFAEENLEKWGLKTHVEKAFSGQAVFTPTVEFPNRTLIGESYGTDYAFVSLYEDINSYPMFDNAGKLSYVVTVFLPARRLNERQEVKQGREYIEAHWEEPFDAASIAQAASLSVSRFVNMFMEEVGFSPRAYYLEIKFKHIKDKLLNANLSIVQAFAACGVDYNSYYVSLFKANAGMTPSQYRKSNIKPMKRTR